MFPNSDVQYIIKFPSKLLKLTHLMELLHLLLHVNLVLHILHSRVHLGSLRTHHLRICLCSDQSLLVLLCSI